MKKGFWSFWSVPTMYLTREPGRGVKGFLNNVLRMQNWYFGASQIIPLKVKAHTNCWFVKICKEAKISSPISNLQPYYGSVTSLHPIKQFINRMSLIVPISAVLADLEFSRILQFAAAVQQQVCKAQPKLMFSSNFWCKSPFLCFAPDYVEDDSFVWENSYMETGQAEQKWTIT